MEYVDHFVKDPDAVLDYLWNWTEYLRPGETIVSAQILAPLGITLDSQQATGTTVTGWFSGGTVNQEYMIPCRVVTSQNRTDDRSIYIRITEK